ncbi:Sodium/hydrogen exchanger [Mycena venus]|uniref:Sodium/hydrogen exchanger n=1 Tax=Mycena venus TaxID=2733690 RepID=A0A8H7DF23_9AGAR|nr:Sodium/hydrogen exchanger [Mycena venus]
MEPVPTQAPVPEEEEFYSSWSLFLVCLLLILSLWTSYYLQIKRIRAVHETGVSILAGMTVGLVVRLAPGTAIREMLTFKHTLFFNLLLPPIILNSGYELKQENFFRNFGSILTFAFLGTFISAVGVGILVYVYSFLGLESLDLGLVECLKFGSTLSATDPVTILAIFNQYKVDPKLYTVIFGESLLNDAVSIVMYETLTKFHGLDEIFISSIFKGIGIFLLSFSVSMALGVAFGLAIRASSPSARTPATFFSNGLTMSGIVSLLFCGITLKHYAYHTMSRRTQRTTKYIFSTLAQLSENFIFIYLGMSLFTSPPTEERVTSYVKPIFIMITTVAVIFTRYAAVFPLSEAINFFHRHVRGQRAEELPHSYQMMLFWAGLRGAVGVALAAGFTGRNAQTLRMTVLVVVVLTVLLFGGTTARMLEVLGIRTGVEDEAAVGGRGNGNAAANMGRWGRYVDDEPSYLQPNHQNRDFAAGRIGTHYGFNNYNHQQQAQAAAALNRDMVPPSPIGQVFSSGSSEYDSDGEVLPLATTSMHPHQDGTASPAAGHPPRPNAGEAGAAAAVGEDGKWFQALDERYLLPLFSNATASRTFHARRAQRRTASGAAAGGSGGPTSVVASPTESDDEGAGADDEGEAVELGVPPAQRTARPGNIQTLPQPQSRVVEEARMERGLASPVLRQNSSGERLEHHGMT